MLVDSSGPPPPAMVATPSTSSTPPPQQNTPSSRTQSVVKWNPESVRSVSDLHSMNFDSAQVLQQNKAHFIFPNGHANESVLVFHSPFDQSIVKYNMAKQHIGFRRSRFGKLLERLTHLEARMGSAQNKISANLNRIKELESDLQVVRSRQPMLEDDLARIRSEQKEHMKEAILLKAVVMYDANYRHRLEEKEKLVRSQMRELDQSVLLFKQEVSKKRMEIENLEKKGS